jgi:hypothetical protein
MHNDDEVIECKTVLRGKKQITLKSDDLQLVERTAVAQGRRPVLHIEIANRGYVVLTEEDYAEMAWRQDDDATRGGGGV